MSPQLDELRKIEPSGLHKRAVRIFSVDGADQLAIAIRRLAAINRYMH